VACLTSIFAGLVTNAFVAKESSPVLTNPTDATPREHLSLAQKIKKVFRYGYVEMMEDIGKMLLLGLIIAGLITYFVPDNFFTLFGNNTILTMFLVLAVSIPMYVCATGSIPIAIALMMKGMSPGTALVLLMAGPAANIASMLVIAKVLGRKTFLLYLTTLIIGAIASGLFIDNFLPASWFDVSNFAVTVHHHGSFYYFKVLCSIILLMLFINTMFLKKKKNVPGTQHRAIKFKIDGMTCNHCKSNVARVISNLNSVKQVTVDLSTGFAYVEGNPTDEEIKSSVEAIGFKFKGRF
jgi:copper chaperone CopZ